MSLAGGPGFRAKENHMCTANEARVSLEERWDGGREEGREGGEEEKE